MWTRGHRSAPRIPENTAIDERRMSGAFPCVPLWHKRRGLSLPLCATLTPANSTIALPTVQWGFVSSMHVGLSARVVIYDSHTVEGCCRRDELGSNVDRELQEGPGSSGVRRLTGWLQATAAVPHAVSPRETPTPVAGRRCLAPRARVGAGRLPALHRRGRV